MIVETIIHPSMIVAAPAMEEERAIYHNWFVHLLQELQENGVLYFDERDIILKALLETIDALPQGHKKRARLCLEKLEKAHRLVRVPIPEEDAPTGNHVCDWINAVARLQGDSLTLLVPHKCLCDEGSGCPIANRNGISLAQARLLDFLSNRHERSAVVHRQHELDREAFEQRVWLPAVKHAKRVTVIDRFVARSAQPRRGQQYSGLKPRFTDAIWWLAKSYIHNGSRPRIFEVFTDVEERTKADVVRKIHADLTSLAREIEQYARDNGKYLARIIHE